MAALYECQEMVIYLLTDRTLFSGYLTMTRTKLTYLQGAKLMCSKLAESKQINVI